MQCAPRDVAVRHQVVARSAANVEGSAVPRADDAEQRACAQAADAGLEVPVVTFDGGRCRCTRWRRARWRLELPEDNVFGVDAGTPIHSVAHGWVALVPLTPGRHVVQIQNTGTYVAPPGPSDEPITTIIEVGR